MLESEGRGAASIRQLDRNWCIQTGATEESSTERCRVVDLIKINTVRQESNHREREEQKHWGVALMGSIDRSSVQGQWPCPWWPVPHWLDDSHQESSAHAYLTHSHVPCPPPPSHHPLPRFIQSFLAGLKICNSPWSYSPLHSLPAVLPASHWLISFCFSSHHLPPPILVTK